MGILRRLLSSIAGGGGEAGEGRAVGSPFLQARVEEALRALSRVEVPGYDVDIVSSGVVVRVRVSLDGSKIAVFLDYTGSNPGCSFCRFLNDRVWAKILEESRRALEEAGFREVYILDSVTGAPIVVT